MLVRAFVLIMIVALMALGQVGQFTQLELGAEAPPAVSNFGGNFSGAQGGVTTIYYWIVAKYPIGDSIVMGPLAIGNTPARQNLNATNTVELNWVSMPSATGYDIVFSATNVMPAFPCASCGVVLNTALLVLSDDNTNNLAYAGPSAAGEAKVLFNVDNLTESTPFVPVTVNGVPKRLSLTDPDSIVSLVSGTPVVGNCTQWVTTDTIGDTGLPCGAGSGTVDSFNTRVGAVVSANGDYTASQVTNVAAGDIVAITVQAAINELDGDKVAGAALTVNLPVYGNAGNDVIVGTRSGNTTETVSGSGAKTSGDCASWDANGNAVADGAPCGTVTNAAALTVDLPLFGDAANASKVGTKSGNTNEVVSGTGVKTSGDCASWDANGNAIADGAPCATDTTNPVRVTFALCLGIDCAVDTNLTNVWISDATYTISKCYGYAKTAPVGSSLTFDINKNGTTTIFTTPLSILTTANAANTTAIAAAGSLVESDFLTVDIDAVGSGTAGSNVTVMCVMD